MADAGRRVLVDLEGNGTVLVLKGWGRADLATPPAGAAETCRPAPLVLDESRLAEPDEAWVPVLTPDGQAC
ncbi:DUF6210 family protein [Streptomyces sp. SID13726]|uniref:DUF6210 family protein n=1 Tax=Streptomyces sp. SID13726 TaxID=2706058 RepID=UPI0013B9DE3D|nr:DUF6210 family protein [Streptomyces sp. SID13726]NEB05263.1 hypothetical protein [Streptomyces sp. SID13726]